LADFRDENLVIFGKQRCESFCKAFTVGIST